MDLATEEATHRFLEGLWFRHGQVIVRAIINEYKLTTDQAEILEDTLLKPNDWIVKILPSLSK
jgi:hypothetical protein